MASPDERLQSAFARITRWMRAHDAPLLPDNLAPGATEQELDQAEKKLGFPFPPGLRDLWRLHNGQHEELNGFVESLDLFNCTLAAIEHEYTLNFVGFLRDAPEDWAEAGVTEEEALSDRWVPFAGRDSDTLVVSVTGRVFTCGKDAPPLRLLAPSVLAWAEAYAADVEADDFVVDEGFGDYCLQRRDRAAEARDAARDEARAAEERYRRETPLLDQLRRGLTKQDHWRSQEVFERILKEAPGLQKEATALLFSAPDDAFLAETLRVVLNDVTLTAAQWERVEKGGVKLGNEAVRSIAAANKKKAT